MSQNYVTWRGLGRVRRAPDAAGLPRARGRRVRESEYPAPTPQAAPDGLPPEPPLLAPRGTGDPGGRPRSRNVVPRPTVIALALGKESRCVHDIRRLRAGVRLPPIPVAVRGTGGPLGHPRPGNVLRPMAIASESRCVDDLRVCLIASLPAAPPRGEEQGEEERSAQAKWLREPAEEHVQAGEQCGQEQGAGAGRSRHPCIHGPEPRKQSPARGGWRALRHGHLSRRRVRARL